MRAQRRHGASFEELDELLAAAWLDSIASDFNYHGLPPQARSNNPTCDFVEMDYNSTYERHQEGTCSSLYSVPAPQSDCRMPADACAGVDQRVMDVKREAILC